jgi:hypothetical protein
MLCDPEEDGAGNDADQHDQDDVPVPELIHKIAHDVFLCSSREERPRSARSASIIAERQVGRFFKTLLVALERRRPTRRFPER